MAPPRASGDMADGVRALQGADWDAARAAFERVLEREDCPQARAGLGLALWFLGDVAEGIAERERAVDAFAAAGRSDEAARTAVWVSHQHMLGGRPSAARGWLARAERVLGGLDRRAAGWGWVSVERARHTSDVHEQARHARVALDVAGPARDGDLEVFALSLLGRATVAAGRRHDGLALMEEAMSAAAAGRVRDVHTLAEAYCTLLEGCAGAGDWERAAEWCQLVEDFARARQTAPLFGACRAIHADVLVALGDWPAADRALRSSLATHAGYVPQMAAPAVAALAELEIRRGHLRDAERLLAGREEEASALRALALLRLAENRPAEAVALLGRALSAAADHPVRCAHVLAALVEAQLACGDTAAARTAAGRLSAVSGTTDLRLVQALADLADARVALAGGRHDDAAEHARRALGAFGLLSMPYPSGLARLELARALMLRAPALAQDEARTARSTFRRLGAAPAADAAASALRQLGCGTPPRPRSDGDLTEREQEVMELLSLGMSNARIAATLVITEKTAGHHVSHILSKLGASNRTEAVAYASRSR